MLQPTDTLVAAEIAIFFGNSPEEILKSAIKGEDCLGWTDKLQKLKDSFDKLADLTPLELLDKAIQCIELESWIEQHKDSRSKSMVLNKLRCYVALEQGKSSHAICTPSDILQHLYSDPKLENEKESNPGINQDTVNILTYHGSKGLEWPIVIMYDLDKKNRAADQFGTRVKPADRFDPENPLKGREILHLPWVFGSSDYGGGRNKCVFLEGALAGDSVAQQIFNRTEQERRRLFVCGYEESEGAVGVCYA